MPKITKLKLAQCLLELIQAFESGKIIIHDYLVMIHESLHQS